MLYREDFIKTILELYVQGIAIIDIAQFVGTTDVDQINEIIDRYSPYM